MIKKLLVPLAALSFFVTGSESAAPITQRDSYWDIEKQLFKFYRKSNNFCLDDNNTPTSIDGRPLQAAKCDKTKSAQKFGYNLHTRQIVSMSKPGLCVQAKELKEGTQLQLSKCDAKSQKQLFDFYFKNLQRVFYGFFQVRGTKLCLDDGGSTETSVTNANLWTCSYRNDNQQISPVKL